MHVFACASLSCADPCTNCLRKVFAQPLRKSGCKAQRDCSGFTQENNKACAPAARAFAQRVCANLCANGLRKLILLTSLRELFAQTLCELLAHCWPSLERNYCVKYLCNPLRGLLAQSHLAHTLTRIVCARCLRNPLHELVAHISFAQTLARVVCAKCSRNNVRELVAQVYFARNILRPV